MFALISILKFFLFYLSLMNLFKLKLISIRNKFNSLGRTCIGRGFSHAYLATLAVVFWVSMLSIVSASFFYPLENNSVVMLSSIFCIVPRSQTFLSVQKTIKLYLLPRRQMHRAVAPMYNCAASRMSLIPTNGGLVRVQTSMSYIASVRVKKNGVSALANDESGKHTHVSEEFCFKTDCEKKTCLNLCDTLKEVDIIGHNTHKPRLGRFCRFVSEIDANGNPVSQYFVPTNKQVKIPPKTYLQDVKPDAKQQPYIEKHKDIYEKD